MVHCKNGQSEIFARETIIAENSAKYLDEEFIMRIFDVLENELPPVSQYLEKIFVLKKNATIVRNSKVMSSDLICVELFYPTRDENIHQTNLVDAMGES